MVPNHEKKEDYYVNMCLSQLIDELRFYKMVGNEVFPMKPKHPFIYPNKENEFIIPHLEKKKDYYVNLCLSKWTDKY